MHWPNKTVKCNSVPQCFQTPYFHTVILIFLPFYNKIIPRDVNRADFNLGGKYLLIKNIFDDNWRSSDTASDFRRQTCGTDQ